MLIMTIGWPCICGALQGMSGPSFLVELPGPRLEMLAGPAMPFHLSCRLMTLGEITATPQHFPI